MSQRADELSAIAERQIDELIRILSDVDEATLRLPCPGRAKLGDGTIAAAARHTAENYQRIAGFVQTGRGQAGTHPPAGAHPAPHHGDGTPAALVRQLSDARHSLAGLATLTEAQLDTIPPDGTFRFCDGQRALAQVLAGLLNHQGHQVDAVRAAAG